MIEQLRLARLISNSSRKSYFSYCSIFYRIQVQYGNFTIATGLKKIEKKIKILILPFTSTETVNKKQYTLFSSCKRKNRAQRIIYSWPLLNSIHVCQLATSIAMFLSQFGPFLALPALFL